MAGASIVKYWVVTHPSSIVTRKDDSGELEVALEAVDEQGNDLTLVLDLGDNWDAIEQFLKELYFKSYLVMREEPERG